MAATCKQRGSFAIGLGADGVEPPPGVCCPAWLLIQAWRRQPTLAVVPSFVREHPRIREVVKWGGLALTVTLAALWAVSARFEIVATTPLGKAGTVSVYFLTGILQFNWNSGRNPFRPPSATDIDTGYSAPDIAWNALPPNRNAFAWWRMGVHNDLSVTVPGWFPAAATFITTAIAWRLDRIARRRRRDGTCWKCGYERTGLASQAACPECGAAA